MSASWSRRKAFISHLLYPLDCLFVPFARDTAQPDANRRVLRYNQPISVPSLSQSKSFPASYTRLTHYPSHPRRHHRRPAPAPDGRSSPKAGSRAKPAAAAGILPRRRPGAKYDPKGALSAVSAVKNRGFKVEEAEAAFRAHEPNWADPAIQTLAKFWKCYEQAKQVKFDILAKKPSRRLDFDDLLIETLTLLQEQPSVREKYQSFFQLALLARVRLALLDQAEKQPPGQP